MAEVLKAVLHADRDVRHIRRYYAFEGELTGVSSAISLQQSRDKYPNNLREARTQAQITRVQLVRRCDDIAAQKGSEYVRVGLGAIKFLEAGVRRPRLTTAKTLAAALSKSIQEIFPHGVDDPNRVSGL